MGSGCRELWGRTAWFRYFVGPQNVSYMNIVTWANYLWKSRNSGGGEKINPENVGYATVFEVQIPTMASYARES